MPMRGRWLVAALCLGLAACGGGEDEDARPSTWVESTPPGPSRGDAALLPPPGFETSGPIEKRAPKTFAFPEPGGAPLPRDRLVEKLLVKKGDRRLYAFVDGAPIKAYQIALGFEPQGHKAFAGDGRTPEGHYSIDRKNAYSDFHLSLGVSYPNQRDKLRAETLGVSPGGDIMIHGFPDRDPFGRGFVHPAQDWTWGCIAVTNLEIEELWRAVPVGTPIEIRP